MTELKHWSCNRDEIHDRRKGNSCLDCRIYDTDGKDPPTADMGRYVAAKDKVVMVRPR